MDKQIHHIVIIPGILTGKKTGLLAKKLVSEGFHVHLFHYPVKEWTIDRAALMLAAFVDMEVLKDDPANSVSFIGCGTGSLVERYYLSHYEVLPARRCIIIADPIHPSDKYRKKKPGWLGIRKFGIPLAQLVQGKGGFPKNCGNPPIPFGVIVTGSKKHEIKDKTNNSFINNSIYTHSGLLKVARDIVYVPKKCNRAIAGSLVVKYIVDFLNHSWFENN